MSKFDRKKIAVTLAFAALFSNKTLAMDNTSKGEVKSSQTLGAVGGAATTTFKGSYADRELSNKSGWSTGKKVILGTGIVASILAVGLVVYGVKCYSDKKLLEDAITFLGGNPVIEKSSKEIDDDDQEDFKKSVKLFSVLLALFKDGKVDEMKKINAEVGIQGGVINIKTTKSVSGGNKLICRYVISKNNNESWSVKRYHIDKGVEEFVIEVTLKPARLDKNKEKQGKRKQETENKEIVSNVNSDEMNMNSSLKEIEEIEKNLKKMVSWTENVRCEFGV